MIVMYGSTTCEDTAITRSRLDALGVPYQERLIDRDPAAREALDTLAGGRIVTPTLDPGDGGSLLAEPSLEELGRRLVAGGHHVAPPTADAVGGDLAARPIPIASLPTADGEPWSLRRWRGRRATALFLAHDAACLPCWGYAKQLARQADALAEVEAAPVVVVAGEPADAATWRHEVGESLTLLADADGAWKATLAAYLGFDPARPTVLLLDRYGAPSGVSSAEEAGGLVDPSEATRWLRHLALECPECTEILPWGEP
ncbi:MAG TPA: glutaredoxin family protein [Candidatus Limnocylindria bacterium]|nr:glutaredoxin family protein [Candidatus Limnocylindria bacterium]